MSRQFPHKNIYKKKEGASAPSFPKDLKSTRVF